MTTPACPYSSKELFNSENKAIRNLHDDANKYYRNVMGLKTPLTSATQPKLSESKDSIMSTAKDCTMNKMLFDLRETPLKKLFHAPDNTVGLLR